MAQPFRERQHLLSRLDSEFLLDHVPVHRGVPQRPCAVPARVERPHEPERHAGVVRVLGRPHLPPIRRSRKIPLPFG